MSISTSGVGSRRHRTALFVDAEAYADGNPFKERVDRLRESVNGSNIKVDLYSFHSGAVGDGLTITPFGASVASEVDEGLDTAEAIREWAGEQGYDQVLIDLAP